MICHRNLLIFAYLLAVLSTLWAIGFRSFHHLFGVFGVFPITIFGAFVVVTYFALAVAYWRWPRNPRNRRIHLFQICALTACLTIGVAFIEFPAVFKLVDYRQFFGYSEDWDPIHNRVDSELITVHRSHGRLKGRFSGAYAHTLGTHTKNVYEVDVEWDRNGFRNRCDETNAEVVVLGDSFVESPLVRIESIASTRLADKLGAKVVNLGQSGFGAQQELLTLQRFGLAISPRMVIWVFYEGNDLGDFNTYESIMANGLDQWVAQHDSFWKRSFTRSLLSWTAQLTRQKAVWNARGARLFGELGSHSQDPPGRMYFSHNRQLAPEEYPSAIPGSQKCIREAKKLCDERDMGFVLVFAPEPYRVYHDLLTFPPNSPIVNWRINDLPDRFQKWAQDEGIVFVDLTSALHQAAAAGKQVYFEDDPHWTAEGNEVVAQALEGPCRQFLRRATVNKTRGQPDRVANETE